MMRASLFQNTRRASRASYCAIAVLLWIGFVWGCFTKGWADEPETVLLEEPFIAKLSEGWSWVREDAAAWKIGRGEMIIRVQPGYLHAQEVEKNRTKNLLLRSLPAGADLKLPVAVEVRIESDPQIQFEHAGVLWYLDDANFVDLLHEKTGDQGSVLMVTKTANQPQHHSAICHSNTLWFRLIISGGEITGQFRETPNEPWRTVAKTQLPSLPTAARRVGMICGGGGKESDRVAKFSQFRIVQLGK